MLSLNEKIIYENKGDFLVISINENGYTLEDETAIFIFNRISTVHYENVDDAVSKLSWEFDMDEKNLSAARKEIKTFIEELLLNDIVVMNK